MWRHVNSQTDRHTDTPITILSYRSKKWRRWWWWWRRRRFEASVGEIRNELDETRRERRRETALGKVRNVVDEEAASGVRTPDPRLPSQSQSVAALWLVRRTTTTTTTTTTTRTGKSPRDAGKDPASTGSSDGSRRTRPFTNDVTESRWHFRTRQVLLATSQNLTPVAS